MIGWCAILTVEMWPSVPIIYSPQTSSISGPLSPSSRPDRYSEASYMTHPRPRCEQGGGGCAYHRDIRTYAASFNHVTGELPARPGFGISLPEKRFRPENAGSFHYTCFPC